MTLMARLNAGALVVSGRAASSSYSDVRINAHWSGIEVVDNGVVGVEVPVDTDGSVLAMIDARGLTGAAASIMAGFSGRGTVYGSAQDDYISVYGSSGRVIVNAGGGSDNIVGSNNSDALWGVGGHDTIYGYAGDDRLIGGIGNDLLDGGGGFDTAVYTGNRSDYSLQVQDGVFVLTDLRVRSPDGTDRLANVEQLQFDDGVFTMPASTIDWGLLV